MQFESHEGTAKLTHPCTERSKNDITNQLLTLLDRETTGLQLLEIASGSGQHLGFYAPKFPNITFQPTEIDRLLFDSINAYAEDCADKNMRRAFYADIMQDIAEWEVPQQQNSYDYIFNSNTFQAVPWAGCIAIFQLAYKLLKPQGKMICYGTFAIDGVLAPESNVKFDQFLKSRDPQFGVRDTAELKKVAKEAGIAFTKLILMPNNNQMIVWTKEE